MTDDLVEKTKEYFINTVNKAEAEYSYLLRHLPQVEKWVIKLMNLRPEIDERVMLLSVWLHDIGQVVGNKDTDHAINSETEARRFLGELVVDEELINKITHCVRAHRCKDVEPETIEAKALAVADSASHMTDTVYIDMANRGELERAKEKLERDYRDASLFPEIEGDVTFLYQTWKKLLDIWPI